ncbi:MFS transporter [Streptomyces sp. NPDC046909]|uniref:MFS transporter n=1 Tax=Streptomyces sp. NPDC046909 TaxID=3155617 RepID=UPI0033EA74F7
MLVDSLGSGLWMPFSLLFFVRAQGQSLGTIGLALTVGALLGLGVGQLSGGFVDRFGPGPAVVVGNVARAASFACYPFAHSSWQVMLLVGVTSAADRVFWTANAPLIATVVHARELDKFLGTTGMARVIGLGIGSGAAGVFGGSVTGLHLVAYVNAATFAAAGALLVLALGPGVFRLGSADRADADAVTDAGAETSAGATGPAQADAVSVWRNLPYLQLCLLQVVFVIGASAFVVILPLVISDELQGPTWLAGISIVVGNVILAALQHPVLAWAAKRSRARMLAISVLFYVPALLLLAPGGALASALVVPVVLVAAALAALGELISTPLMISAANASAPKGYEGRYSAVFQTGWGLANVLGPLLYTTLLGAGNAVLWVTLAALTAATVPVLVRLRDRLPAGVLTTDDDPERRESLQEA